MNPARGYPGVCLFWLVACIEPTVIGEQAAMAASLEPKPTTEDDDADGGVPLAPPTAIPRPTAGPQPAAMMPEAGGPSDDNPDSGLRGTEPGDACLPSDGCQPCALNRDCPSSQPICAERRCRPCQDYGECIDGYCDEDGSCEPEDEAQEDEAQEDEAQEDEAQEDDD